MANKNKFLFFNNASDDAVAVSSEFIAQLDQTGDGTIAIQASAGAGGTDVGTEIVLNVTSGKEKDVIKALAEVISTGTLSFYTIADDDTSVYLNANITSCGAIAEAK